LNPAAAGVAFAVALAVAVTCCLLSAASCLLLRLLLLTVPFACDNHQGVGFNIPLLCYIDGR